MGQTGKALRFNANQEDGGGDVKKQVDSDDKHQKPIYQLVNVKNGGGKLIELIKNRAAASNSMSSSFNSSTSNRLSGATRISNNRPTDDEQLDRQIYQLVEPLLYDKGRGKLMSLSDMWRWRFGRQSSVSDSQVPTELAAKNPGNYRLVCWKLEERGHVGETALHICFLLSTPTHMILAQKLLAMFPLLINDIYTCDQYFGESSLHMAIVNEDVRIVRLLLSHGANVHDRCLGSFFLPIDLKDKTNGAMRRHLDRCKDLAKSQLDLQSNHFSSLETNYDGFAYWGEYPLSFAACLGLADCYKLLLAKGANPNLQDSNGNSTLHMTVVADRLDMFDLCYSTGGDLNLANKQNLTPLKLAAKLRKVELFFHILTIKRQVDWIFCDVGFISFPLAEVDSISISDGSISDNSVLSIVVFGDSNEHLQMLDGLLSQLLAVKWQTYARAKFYSWLSLFFAFMFVSCVAYITRFKSSMQMSGIQVSGFSVKLESVSEMILLSCVIVYLVLTFRRLTPSLRLTHLVKSLSQAPELFIFSLTCLLILTTIPLRLMALHRVENFVAAIVMFSLPLKFLFFCRGSKNVGSFIVMIYKILVNDVLCFVVFLVIFVAGFSQSFLIMFRTHRSFGQQTIGEVNETQAKDNNYFINVFDGVISMHMMALNEFTSVFDQFDSTSYPILARVMFCIYMVLVSILLINMLIAMLGKTYQDIASQPNESLRQWARALLIVERMCSSSQRLSFLDRYSHGTNRSSHKSTERHYNSTWALKTNDIRIIESLRQLRIANEASARHLAK